MYQGWKNEQTWCVALTFDNEKITQDRALSIVRDNQEYPHATDALLRDFAGSIPGKVYDMAPWAWEGDKDLSFVSWTEIREHYERKIKEGA